MSLYVVLCTKYTNKICLNQMQPNAFLKISLVSFIGFFPFHGQNDSQFEQINNGQPILLMSFFLLS